VTATTVLLMVLGADHLPAGLNNLAAWCGYIVAIVLAAPRSDGRIALFAGALAIAQYSLLVLVVMATADSPEQLISSDYGAITLGGQAQRVLLRAAPFRQRAP
jgi:Na+-driven multidrug efflux pump